MTHELASRVIGALVVSYIVGVYAFCRVLQTQHLETWIRLGRPGFLNMSLSNAWKMFKFVVFSNSYRSLKDVKLAITIWTLRIGYFLILAAIVSNGLYLWKR